MVSATRYTEATRQAIVQAAVELLVERRGDNFSVQEVAKRAGLTHRTVYRHFPTRQALLTATAREFLPRWTVERFEDVTTIDGWIEAVAAHFSDAEAQFDVARSVLAAMFGAADAPQPRTHPDDRDAHRWAIFRRELPHLSDTDARATFATMRHLLSSTSYVLYRLRFGFSPAQATRAIQGAAQQISDQARSRDRAAAHMRKKR